MDHVSQLPSQNLLGLVEVTALPLLHLGNLLHGQEGQQTDALENIGIVHIAPVLVEVIGRSLVGVEPHGITSGLAHLVAVGVGQQCDGHAVCVLAELLADELRTAQHIAPLVVAAELHITAVVLEQVVEVVGLHNHVVELQEAQTLFHTLFVAVGAEHIVDGEAGTDLAQQVHIVQA